MGGTADPLRRLFFGAKPGDVQPDWVNLDKVAIPQADEQQRLLANLIGQMNQDRKPLPRFWFLPHDKKAAVVMTGDDHGNGGTEGRFDQYEALSPSGCSVADWECVRGTSYIYPNTPPSPTPRPPRSRPQGFEIGLHVTTNCANWTLEAELESFYSSQLADLRDQLSLASSPPSTNRTHCIAWSDWATQPKVELENGIRLDTNYYYWPPDWVQDRPGMFTGSGMPMRFADLDGSMIDVYQAATQMTDESGQTEPVQHRLAARQGARPRGLLRRLHRQHAHRQRLASGLRRDRRLGAVARRAGRLRTPDARVARRPQRVLVQLADLERQQPRLHDRRRGRRERAAGDGADHLVGGRAHGRPAGRDVDPDDHADDQGRRVRVLRRGRRQL